MRPLMRLFYCLLLAICLGLFAYSGLAVAQGPLIGEIRMFAGEYDNIPDGFLLAEGSCYAPGDYPDLFAVIGYTYGSDGDNFCLPDLRAKFPVGSSMGWEICGGACPYFWPYTGDSGGEVSHTLTIAEMPAHNHYLNLYTQTGDGAQPNVPRDASTTLATIVGGPTKNTGGGNLHNNLPPYLALNFIIAYTTTQITPTPTPTPTATPIFTTSLPYISAYTHTLSYSGKTLVVPVYTTFGELMVSAGVLAVLSIFVLGFVFRLVYRQ